MENNVPQIYSAAERRLLPLRTRIMDLIYDTEEDLTVAEVIGLLEIIKFEIIATETTDG